MLDFYCLFLFLLFLVCVWLFRKYRVCLSPSTYLVDDPPPGCAQTIIKKKNTRIHSIQNTNKQVVLLECGLACVCGWGCRAVFLRPVIASGVFGSLQSRVSDNEWVMVVDGDHAERSFTYMVGVVFGGLRVHDVRSSVREEIWFGVQDF